MPTAAIVTMALLPVIAYAVWIAQMGEDYPLAPEDRTLIWAFVGNGTLLLAGVIYLLLVGALVLNMGLGLDLWPMRLLIDSSGWGPR